MAQASNRPPIDEEVLQNADEEIARIVRWMIESLYGHGQLRFMKVIRHIRKRHARRYFTVAEDGEFGIDPRIPDLLYEAVPKGWIACNRKGRHWHRGRKWK